MRRPLALAALLAAGIAVAGCSTGGGSPVMAGPTGSDGATTTVAPGPGATTGAPVIVPVVLTGDGLSGRADVTYEGTRLCIGGVVAGIGEVTAVDVHDAATGAQVAAFDLAAPVEGAFSGCTEVGAEGGVLVLDGAAYYVDVHTADRPDGAVRGSLSGG